MKNLYIAIFVILFVWVFPATSAEVPIEADAIIHQGLTKKQINAIATLIKIYDYRCDSVSVARPYLLKAGFRVICNNHRYLYSIEDRGGNWVVCYKKCK